MVKRRYGSTRRTSWPRTWGFGAGPRHRKADQIDGAQEMSNATTRQKQFLRALGHRDVANLTKEQASQLIDRLLEVEKQSGKTFPCPYCRKLFGPRPKRTKKCPHCGQTIYHICGKFLIESQVGDLNQKEWFKEERDNVKVNIRDDWKDEQEFRREFKEKHTVGYLVKIGPNCPHASHLQGLLVTLEDARAKPNMLPPYDGCRYDTCQCEYEPVSADEVPKRTRVAEWVESAPKQRQKSGCLGLVLFVLLIATACTLWW